jgi:hypothetical protein
VALYPLFSHSFFFVSLRSVSICSIAKHNLMELNFNKAHKNDGGHIKKQDDFEGKNEVFLFYIQFHFYLSYFIGRI